MKLEDQTTSIIDSLQKESLQEKTSASASVNAVNELENAQSLDQTWDGGLEAWTTTAGGWLAMFATFGLQNAFGVFQDYYGQQHTSSASGISWIGSTQLFLITSMGLISGKLVDRGYFRQTFLAGSIIFTLSYFMLSIAHTDKWYQLFLSQGLGTGIGGGLIYIPSLAVQAHRWRTHRSLAMGIVFTGSSLAGIAYPIMLNRLFDSGLGYGWSVRASAFIVLACLLAANLLMRPRKELTGGQAGSPATPTLTIKDLFTDLPYVLLVIGAFLSLAGAFYPFFYVQVFSRSHGIPDSVGFYTLAIVNAASIPGRVVLNMVSRKLGVFNLVIFSGTAYAIVIFALFGVKSVTGIIIFALLTGFFSGAYLSLLGVATALNARNSGEVGLRMGLAFFFGACGALIGTPIDGALLGPTENWGHSIIFTGVMMLAGMVFVAASRHLIAKRTGTWII